MRLTLRPVGFHCDQIFGRSVFGEPPWTSFSTRRSSKPAANGRCATAIRKRNSCWKSPARELAERLSVVERHFDKAVELHGYTGLTAGFLAETGKVAAIERIETDARLRNRPTTRSRSPRWRRCRWHRNRPISRLAASLHLTNDTPGVFIQIRRALKPDGLFLAAIPGSGTLAGTAGSRCLRPKAK